jgi:calcineurin-like phosphoesterase family protein
MNIGMIDAWNEVVKDDDTVYHLGDFGYEANKPEHMPLEYIGGSLNGTKILIRGNHDWESRNKCLKAKDAEFWDETHDYLEVKFGKTRFVMFHYPIESWHGAHRGRLHLHGHLHSQSNVNSKWYKPHRYDVGVDDTTPFGQPYSFEELRDMLNLQEDYLATSHHGEN